MDFDLNTSGYQVKKAKPLFDLLAHHGPWQGPVIARAQVVVDELCSTLRVLYPADPQCWTPTANQVRDQLESQGMPEQLASELVARIMALRAG